MDGAKFCTDTTDVSKKRGREACCWGRSVIVRWRGPGNKEDPAMSSTKVG